MRQDMIVSAAGLMEGDDTCVSVPVAAAGMHAAVVISTRVSADLSISVAPATLRIVGQPVTVTLGGVAATTSTGTVTPYGVGAPQPGLEQTPPPLRLAEIEAKDGDLAQSAASAPRIAMPPGRQL